MPKKLFDIIFALIGIIIASPLMVYLAIRIKTDSPGPILYKGLRMGKNFTPFHMLKFRTMVTNADKIGGPTTSDNDPRITAVGHFMRKYKLDELPQFFNVLQGEMSFVGPRPEVVSEVNAHPDRYTKILSVTPGITDFASLRFPNEGEIVKGAIDPHKAYQELIQPEKMRLQGLYVDNRSFLTDIVIIIKTLRAILTKKRQQN